MACCKNVGLLILRVTIGALLMMHGYGKLFGDMPGMEKFTGMVAGMGFPMPGFFAYAAALSEFLGGLALILGVFTGVASVFIAITLLVAWGGVMKFSVTTGESAFLFLMATIAIGLMGPGKYSACGMLCKGRCPMGVCGMNRESCKDGSCDSTSGKMACDTSKGSTCCKDGTCDSMPPKMKTDVMGDMKK